ncbi:Rad17-domain-containing protein [Dacryopinax primogenitus]|uniref:Rad17-domain-containing protein n=1 Tax=Dacryopinax primogenitus (strain DJM 731) TaxID=1858805 RepID=M5G773_DACPD|nr:Rad17-domain-containing protein [Dacryopinax primogenitus]EJT99612.1 Rad17-domain-containing protein [Dacryopinax primogenitus]
MAPGVARKGPATKKGKTDKPTPKHVQLGLAPVHGTQKPLRQTSLPRFSVPISPSSSQDVDKTTPVRVEHPASSPKGKEKAVEVDDDNNQMWVDRYAPTSSENLAVHKRKIDEVRHWLDEAITGGPTGKLKRYRRLLALTGPAGAGKTATIQVLAKELGIQITEWRNDSDVPLFQPLSHESFESSSFRFETYLSHTHSVLPWSPPNPSTAGTSAARLLLLEDLPNVLHADTRQAFQSYIQGLVESGTGPPIVLIVSESGSRAMGADTWRREEKWDIRNILGPRLMNSPYMMEIQFNAVAPTIMHTALSRILSQTHPTPASLRPSPETLDIIVEGSNGDIRSAISALQFACRLQMAEGVKGGGSGKRRRGKKGKPGDEVRRIIEGLTRNEQILALFHIIGKILYNKRYGDPEEKEEQHPKALEEHALPLPPHLHEFRRRPSKVDPNVLYADSPVDISLLSTYCHQNYPQFCTEMDEMEAGAEWISYSEAFSLDPEHFNPQLPEYAFHLLIRGMLMSLPSPVPRRNQKLLKSAFWEINRKERDAQESLRSWSHHNLEAAREHRSTEMLERAWLMRRVGSVQPREVLELAYMPWMPPIRGGEVGQQLLEGEVPDMEPDMPISQRHKVEVDDGEDQEAENGHWLEDDDIESE